MRLDGEFSGASAQSVTNIISFLHAVIRTDARGTIRTYHQSFLDYLPTVLFHDEPRWKTLEETHAFMYSSCIRTLLADEGGLKFNICGIEKPVFNKDIPDLQNQLSQSVSDALAYSSLFWFAHLKQSKLSGDVVQDVVSGLLCAIKLLFWLELSILRGTLEPTAQILDECTAFFKVSIAIRSQTT